MFNKDRFLELCLLFTILGICLIILFANISGKNRVPKEFFVQPSARAGVPQEQEKIILPAVIFNISGAIQAINPADLMVKALIIRADSNGVLGRNLEMRKVKITSETKFSQLKIEEELGRQIIKEIGFAFKDLKVGDYVEVIANYNIINKTEFEASQVRLSPKSARF